MCLLEHSNKWLLVSAALSLCNVAKCEFKFHVYGKIYIYIYMLSKCVGWCNAVLCVFMRVKYCMC